MITESKTCEACCGQTKTTMHVLCFCNCGTEVWKESKLALPCNIQESWSFVDTFRLCLVAVKRFPENTYFSEMLISGKGKCFHGVVAFQKIFRKKFSGVWKRRRKTQIRKCRITQIRKTQATNPGKHKSRITQISSLSLSDLGSLFSLSLSLSLSLSFSGSYLKWKWGEKMISGSKVKILVNRKSFSGKWYFPWQPNMRKMVKMISWNHFHPKQTHP